MKKLKSSNMTSRMMRIIEGDRVYLEKYSHLIPDNYYIKDNAWGGYEVRGTKIDSWAADYRGPS